MKKGKQKIPWYLLLTFLVLSLNIWAAGYYYYHTEKESIQKDKQEDLLAIADLKVKQITDWRRERIGDGEILSQDPFFALHVREWFQGKDSGLKQKIFLRIQSFQEYYQYKSIVLLDSEGDIRLAVPGGNEVLGPDARQLTAQAIRTKKIIFSSLYKSKIQNVIRLTVVIPLIVSGEPGGEPTGVLLLRVDPFQFLYPLLQSWPTPSKSAETILVRREGSDVVFLNELRHRKDTALTLRFPLSEQNLPAAMAVRGREGIVEGDDYRGVPVIAALKHIPDSPWFLIAKVDQEEIYAPVRQRLWITTILVSVMILAAGGFIGLIWRHQGAIFYQERYEAELKRLALLQHFEYLTKYANDIILLSDNNLRIIEANERASLSYGYTGDELVRLHLRDLRSPETRPFLEQQMEQAEEQNGLVFETIHQRKDGTRFPAEVSARVIEIEGKKFYQHIVRDTTERKQAEESLIREKQFSDTAINSMPGVFYLFDRNGRFVRWNRNYEIFTGYSAGEISKMEPLDFFSEEEKKLVAERIQQAFIKGYSTVEAHLLAKDGSKTSYLFTGLHLVMDERDFLIGTGTDISDLRQAEKSLRISEEKYRTLLENIPQKIFSKDIHSVYVSCNQSFARDLGITPDDFTGKTDYDFFPKELADKYRADDRRILKSGRAEAIEEKYIHEGKEYVVYTVKTPLRDEQGDTTGILGIFWDITEQKHAEEELKRYREHLEELIQERTAELEAANKELESFSYSVSHDLRSPLRSIDGFSRMLLEDYSGKLDEEGRKYIHRVRNASQRMGQLIDDLLSLSRVSRREMRHELVDLSALANTIAADLGDMQPERQIEWNIQPGIFAPGDAGLLRILFENLLGNAVKFTGKTEDARIEFGRADHGGEEAYCVRDNGAGFDMTYSDKLFGAFQRLHLQDEFPGTGIGLAIVQRIVNRHGGRIWAEGTLDKGAAFFFTLPSREVHNRT